MIVMRSLVLGIFALCLVGVAADAGGDKKGKVKDLILGKWKLEKKEKFGGDKEIEVSIQAEFLKDGTLKFGFKIGDPVNKDVTAEGKYKIIDESTIEAELAPPGKTETKTETLKIETLNKKTLIVSHDKGGKTERLEFMRAK